MPNVPRPGQDPRQKNLSLAQLRAAFQSAKAHVYRQIHAGKHEQDRKDAQEWWDKYGKANP